MRNAVRGQGFGSTPGADVAPSPAPFRMMLALHSALFQLPAPHRHSRGSARRYEDNQRAHLLAVLSIPPAAPPRAAYAAAAAALAA